MSTTDLMEMAQVCRKRELMCASFRDTGTETSHGIPHRRARAGACHDKSATPSGVVISTEPAPGDLVPVTSIVTLVVAGERQLPEEVTGPDAGFSLMGDLATHLLPAFLQARPYLTPAARLSSHAGPSRR